MESKKLFKTAGFGFNKNDVIEYITSMNNTLSELDNKLNSANDVICDLNTELKSEKEFKEQLKKQYEEQITSLSKTIEFLKCENNKLTSENSSIISGNENQMKIHKSEFNNLQEKYNSLNDKYTSQTEKFDILSNEHNTLKMEYSKNLSALSDKMQSYEETKDKLVDSIMSAQKQAGSIIEAANRKAEEIILSAKKESSDLMLEANNKIQHQLNIMNDKIREKLTEKNNIKKDINNMYLDYENKIAFLEKLSNDFAKEFDRTMLEFYNEAKSLKTKDSIVLEKQSKIDIPID